MDAHCSPNPGGHRRQTRRRVLLLYPRPDGHPGDDTDRSGADCRAGRPRRAAGGLIQRFWRGYVFFVHKTKPDWVPVQNYNFLNFVPIVFVLDPDYVKRLHMISQTA